MSVLATWRAFYGSAERSGGPCALSTARAKARAAFPYEGAVLPPQRGGPVAARRGDHPGRLTHERGPRGSDTTRPRRARAWRL